MGDLKLLPPQLHNKLKSSIDRTILALGRINAPTHNQRAAEIGVGIVYNGKLKITRETWKYFTRGHRLCDCAERMPRGLFTPQTMFFYKK